MGRTRYAHSQPPPLRRLPGSALRAVFAEGYSATDLRRDVLAGVVVGIVALPLSMALAIESGSATMRSEEHTSERQSLTKLVFRLLLENKNVSSPQVTI